MRTRPTLVCSLGVALALGLFASCGDDKSPTQPTPIPVPTPTTVTVLRVQLVAPASVEPNGSVQLTLRAEKSDGTTEDVTSQATWSSNNSRVLSVSGGVASGGERGEAFITGRYLNRSASAQMLVLPQGTFKLSGVVADAGIGLEGVTVEVIGGTGEGLKTQTDSAGTYRLYGVAGSVRLHLKRDGYNNLIEQILVNANNSANLSMSFAGQRPKLAGTYDVTFTVQGTCFGGTFPPAARTRRYTGTVEQDGPRLSVLLSGAEFIVTNELGDRFTGTAAGGRLTFEIGDDYYYYTPLGPNAIFERFPPTALVINGIATASETPTGVSGTMVGIVGLTRSAVFPFVPVTTECYSNQHGFEMVRR